MATTAPRAAKTPPVGKSPAPKKAKTPAPNLGTGATEDEPLDTSIDSDARAKVADALKKALADSYALYFKTLGVHWNVTGAGFYGIHTLTDNQYNELVEAADEIAERIRSLGHVAPASYSEYRALSPIDIETPHKGTAEMLLELVADNETAAKRMLEFSNVAEENDDKFTEDMLIARIGKHEQNAWMLRSSIS